MSLIYASLALALCQHLCQPRPFVTAPSGAHGGLGGSLRLIIANAIIESSHVGIEMPSSPTLILVECRERETRQFSLPVPVYPARFVSVPMKPPTQFDFQPSELFNHHRSPITKGPSDAGPGARGRGGGSILDYFSQHPVHMQSGPNDDLRPILLRSSNSNIMIY